MSLGAQFRAQTSSSSLENRSQNLHFETEVDSESKPWRSGDPYRYPLGKDEDSWEKCYNVAKQYDKQMCEAWRDEIQNLLIFAGLFSAVVTAFTIESYKMLQDNGTEISGNLLKQIVLHLSNTSALESAAFSLTTQTSATPSAVRINIFWFLSLTLSLTTVLVGILCLQWLREYQRYGTLLPKDALSLRQMRYEGLVKWKVPDILSGLPVLLQAAFVLFLVGLLDLLWMLNREVALVVAVVVGLVLLFLVATTILPAAQSIIFNVRYSWLYIPQCPYKSPQSWGFYQLGFSITSFLHYAKCRLLGDLNVSFLGMNSSLKSGWFGYDMSWSRYRESGSSGYDLSRALAWIGQNFLQDLDITYAVHHCMSDISTFAAAVTCWMIRHPNNPYRGSHRIQQSVHSHDNVLRDLTTAYTLLHFSTENSRLRRPLLRHRLELYIRIKSSSTPNNLGEAGLAAEDLACPNIHFWSFESREDIPNDTKLQLLHCIMSLLDRDEANESDIRMLWTIIELFPAYSAQTQQPLSESLSVTLDSLQKWMNRSATLRINRRDQIITIILYQIQDHITFTRSFTRLEDKFADLVNALRSLTCCLDKSVTEIGLLSGPSRWKQPWREFVDLLCPVKRTLKDSWCR